MEDQQLNIETELADTRRTGGEPVTEEGFEEANISEPVNTEESIEADAAEPAAAEGLIEADTGGPAAAEVPVAAPPADGSPVTEEKICPSCGAPARDGHLFCPYCGAEIPRTAAGNNAGAGPERTDEGDEHRPVRPEGPRYPGEQRISCSRPAAREAVKERKLPGTIFAFLGIIPGLICQLLLERIGIIATFSSIIGFIGATRGYQKFGRKLSRYGIVICLIATFLMILLGTHISLASELYEAAGEWYISGETDYRLSFLQCMLISPLTLAESEVRAAVLENLLWSIGFAVLGCWNRVKTTWAEQTPARKR